MRARAPAPHCRRSKPFLEGVRMLNPPAPAAGEAAAHMRDQPPHPAPATLPVAGQARRAHAPHSPSAPAAGDARARMRDPPPPARGSRSRHSPCRRSKPILEGDDDGARGGGAPPTSYTWTAPPGWASTAPGRRRRAGPRPPRDGTAGPGLDLPGTAGVRGLFGAQGCAGSPAVSENVCGMSVTALQQEEPPARTRNPEPGPGNLGRQGGETCAHLSSNEKKPAHS